jgi:hypothetical protein
MNIDWEKIENKYLKGFEKLLFYYFDKDYPDEIDQESKKYMIDTIYYCDFEKFFEDNGIDLLELYINQKDIITKQHIWENRDIDKNRIKQEAKEQAIYKAFEILEERLNGKENIRSKNI